MTVIQDENERLNKLVHQDSDAESNKKKMTDLEKENDRLNKLVQDLIKSSDGQTDPAPEFDGPAPPPGMTRINQVTLAMKEQQTKDPRKWTCAVSSWFKILEHTVELPDFKTLKRQKRSVNMYVSAGCIYDSITALYNTSCLQEHRDMFVNPWTKGTGCSLAVLMSKGFHKDAELMLSHGICHSRSAVW